MNYFHALNVDRDLGIKLVIPEYDGKLKPDEFMDWLVCVENIFAHKPIMDGHKIISQLCCDVVGRLVKEKEKSKY